MDPWDQIRWKWCSETKTPSIKREATAASAHTWYWMEPNRKAPARRRPHCSVTQPNQAASLHVFSLWGLQPTLHLYCYQVCKMTAEVCPQTHFVYETIQTAHNIPPLTSSLPCFDNSRCDFRLSEEVFSKYLWVRKGTGGGRGGTRALILLGLVTFELDVGKSFIDRKSVV